MPRRVKKLLPIQTVGRPVRSPRFYQIIEVLRDGKPYRFTSGVDYQEQERDEFIERIRYYGRARGLRASVRTAKDRRSITAQLFKR